MPVVCRRAFLVQVIIGFMATVAFAAGGAPAAALNKTITVSFSVNGMAKKLTGGEAYGYNTLSTRTIYVSSAGRLFSRVIARSGRNMKSSRSAEAGPDTSGGGSFHFQGNSLVGVIPFDSGARQVTLTFDSGFSSCSASIVEGRSSGQSIRRKAPNGEMVEVLSSTIGSPTCSIQSGNSFAS